MSNVYWSLCGAPPFSVSSLLLFFIFFLSATINREKGAQSPIHLLIHPDRSCNLIHQSITHAFAHAKTKQRWTDFISVPVSLLFYLFPSLISIWIIVLLSWLTEAVTEAVTEAETDSLTNWRIPSADQPADDPYRPLDVHYITLSYITLHYINSTAVVCTSRVL